MYKNKLSGLTLLEVLLVVILIGIVASVMVVKFGNVSETSKGKSCRTNMLTILAAWRIYNMSKGNAYVSGIDAGFKNIGTINIKFNTEITEKYFGDAGDPPQYGFYMYAYPSASPPYLRIYADRKIGSTTYRIACDYTYSGANIGYTWNPAGTPTPWPYPLE